MAPEVWLLTYPFDLGNENHHYRYQGNVGFVYHHGEV